MTTMTAEQQSQTNPQHTKANTSFRISDWRRTFRALLTK